MKKNLMIIISLAILFAAKSAFSQDNTPTPNDVRKALQNESDELKVPAEHIYKTTDKTLWNGTDSIKIRIYYPTGNKKQRIIFNIHGGALIAGDLNSHDNICRILANKTQFLVVAVDYRKAPEYPVPASINDCGFVMQWIKANATLLGGNPDDITLVGDSGGGLFATSLAIKLQSNFKVRKMVLINPAVDVRNYEQSPYALVASWYLNGRSPADSLISPILATNISFFPPTLIITSEKDFLKPQGVAFSEKLTSGGIKVKTLDIPNQGHLGGLWGKGHSDAQLAIKETVNFILEP